MIYFYTSDYNVPCGGNWVVYRQVDALNAAGMDAMVLHHEPGFRLDWFENDTRVGYMQEVNASEDDIVVIAALLEKDLPGHFPGLRKVILNQGAYMTLFQYPVGYVGPCHYRDALATIVTSEDSRAYLRHAYPDLPIFRFVCCIDPARFYYDPAQKKEQIAVLVRKDMEHAKQVIWMLRQRGVTCPIIPLQDVSQEYLAKVLRESSIFMNFGCPEGFGLPPAEAMACGCKVVGYDGRGGREFLRPPHAFPIAFSDIVGYVQTVEGLLRGEISVDVQATADFIHTTYSAENERESAVAAWTQILAM